MPQLVQRGRRDVLGGFSAAGGPAPEVITTEFSFNQDFLSFLSLVLSRCAEVY